MQQLAELGWTVIDQGTGIPQDAEPSLRGNFRQWLLPEVFDHAVRAINRTDGPGRGRYFCGGESLLPVGQPSFE